MAKRLRNSGTVPSGMLAPAGLEQSVINPHVQGTTRPAGTLLRPSPGFDSVRVGKNRFQGKGPTGGFRPMEFAEDLGGSGAVLSLIPGDTAMIEKTEWLPESEDSLPEGSLIIADRAPVKSHSVTLHEGHKTIPDMGDRHPSRPLSKLLQNPMGLFREEYQENAVVTIIATTGLVVLAYILGNDLEREYKSRRGKGLASEASAVPASGAATAGNEAGKGTDVLTDAADKAVAAISKAADDAVGAIKDAGSTVKGAGNAVADAT